MKKKFNDTKPIQRDYFLDFLKMICILFVIIHHIFHYLYGTKRDPIYNCENLGFQFYIYQAVPIFMIITAYVGTQSYERAKCKNVGQCYKPYFLLRKFTRLFVPFVVYYLMCLTVAFTVPGTNFSDNNWLQYFFTGGPIKDGTPTSAYYVVLAFSMLVVMPLIGITVKKLGLGGFGICYLFNIIFEVIVGAAKMPSFPYQFIIFRYAGLLGYGVYLAYHKDKKPIVGLVPIAFAIGAAGLALIYYCKPIINFWAEQNIAMGEGSNIFTFPYTIAIMAILVRYCHLKHKAGGFIGSKTGSIFLAQTFIFAYTNGLHKNTASPFVFTNNVTAQCFITLGLIVAISVPFYILIEGLATSNLLKLMEKKHKAGLANKKEA